MLPALEEWGWGVQWLLPALEEWGWSVQWLLLYNHCHPVLSQQRTVSSPCFPPTPQLSLYKQAGEIKLMGGGGNGKQRTSFPLSITLVIMEMSVSGDPW